jgi:hypothetical protein
LQILKYEFKHFDKWKEMESKSKTTILSIHYCRVIYHNFWYSLFINVCIIFALLGNYFNIILFTHKADPVFSIIIIFILFVFLFDFIIYIIGNSLFLDSYNFQAEMTTSLVFTSSWTFSLWWQCSSTFTGWPTSFTKTIQTQPKRT